MARRILLLLTLAGLVAAIAPGVATASVDGDCDGEAIIKGVTYTPDNDTPAKAIPIPDEAGIQVTYSGSVDFENKNHSGVATVQVGPFNITLDKAWSGSNEADDRGVTNKIYQLDDFRDKLPVWIPGVWKVSASHSASGGSCSGFAMIKLEGNPLTNPVGLVVVLGFLGLLYVAIRSLLKGQLIGAAISGLFLGLFLALLLMMFGIMPLDTMTTVILPIVLAILAGGIGFFRARQA